MINDRIRGLSPYKTETTKCKVRLSSNELNFEIPESILNDLKKYIVENNIRLYPDPACKDLKEAISDYVGVPPENIVIGNGSDELIYYLSIAIGNLSKGIYIPVPTFPIYAISATILGRPILEVELNKNFDIDMEATNKIILEERPEIAFFSYPNNPTGNLFTRSSIENIRNSGIFTVVDEAYFDYSGETFKRDALERTDTVVLRTLSKIGMAGLRVGILIANASLTSEIEKMRLPFNVSSLSQKIASFILRTARDYLSEVINKVISERDRLLKNLRSLDNIEVFESKANFILFRTPFPANKIHSMLIEEDVLVRDVSYMPKLAGCLRVSVGKPEENDFFVEKLIKILKRFQ